MRYVQSGVAGVLVCLVAVLGAYSFHLRMEAYRQEHTLIQCNGDYLLYMGTREAAYQFIKASCPTDFSYVPNQSFDPSRQG